LPLTVKIQEFWRGVWTENGDYAYECRRSVLITLVIRAR
jgi:hypothetical protein